MTVLELQQTINRLIRDGSPEALGNLVIEHSELINQALICYRQTRTLAAPSSLGSVNGDE